MAKGSGRRRKTPADGIRYDPELDITNVEQRGGKAFESRTYHFHYHDPGANNTSHYWYGRHGRRWGGRGRKDDYRSWKTNRKDRGKQYKCITLSSVQDTETKERV